RQATRLEPLSANAQTNAALPFYQGRRFSEAAAELRKATSMDPNAMYPHWVLGIAYQAMGASEQAIEAQERAVALTRREMTWPLAMLGGAYASAGREDEARGILRELEERSASVYVPPLHFALVHVALEDRDRAFECFDRAFSERNALCWWIQSAPLFDNLRGDPRYEALLARIVPE